MAFQAGTWNKLPSNCTRSFKLTYFQCAQWGVRTFLECLETSWHFTKKCVEWAWETAKKCSWWSFLVCVLWAVVTTLVCVAVELVAVVSTKVDGGVNIHESPSAAAAATEKPSP
jgi:hypothetical protein